MKNDPSEEFKYEILPSGAVLIDGKEYSSLQSYFQKREEELKARTEES